MCPQLQTQINTTSLQLPSTLHVGMGTGLLQRKCACGGNPGVDGECAECRAKRLSLQRQTTMPATSSQTVPPIVHEVLHSPGYPLDAGTRAFMEPRFGHDFSKVKVHTDTKAAESAQAVNALAYTVGSDVVFGTGQYSPGSNTGKKLLAHELTHTVQQRESVEKPKILELEQTNTSAESEARTVSNAISTGRLVPSIMKKQNGPMIQRDSVSDMETDDIKSTFKVPQWHNLPKNVQTDLAQSGYTQNWYQVNGPDIRLTVLNLYTKLKYMGLWQFVGSKSNTSRGVLEFTCSDVNGLKGTLRSRGDFTRPEDSPKDWSCREMRISGQLHFKHDKGWNWPDTKVHAHIDQIGLIPKNKGEKVLVPVIGVVHIITYESYKDVYGIRDILLGQGLESKPLIGEKPARMIREQPNRRKSGMEEQFGF